MTLLFLNNALESERRLGGPDGGSGSVFAVAGTAAVVAGEPTAADTPAMTPQSDADAWAG
jgi:hypothetical protein